VVQAKVIRLTQFAAYFYVRLIAEDFGNYADFSQRAARIIVLYLELEVVSRAFETSELDKRSVSKSPAVRY